MLHYYYIPNNHSWKGWICVRRYALFSRAKDYTTTVLLTDLSASTSMLVWGAGGESLEDEYGGPLRMLIPNLWGYKSCKWLVKIEFVEKYVMGYWELRGYSHSGDIEPGETYDSIPGNIGQLAAVK
ncbi:molybdopterin-dependent oxidoreductase [Sporomusa malonica]|uniref:Oxidoreductase molybdopterin binding domain-containing protein n=1 Tax=Sporomusa malonica TaxID=112901 RepID=A0A1W2D9Q6_9FIRM|nr:molybdopterin-dependent oxidoreductase [Sporomusa malonica]SMC94297.1 Oxidoreductase molybdopterin binding domain-containing protein [Sporomusa malonica]